MIFRQSALWAVVGCGKSTGAQVFCQHPPCQVFSYEDIGPEQWRDEGVLATPRSMSLGQDIQFSSHVNDAAIDSAARELPPYTSEGPATPGTAGRGEKRFSEQSCV